MMPQQWRARGAGVLMSRTRVFNRANIRLIPGAVIALGMVLVIRGVLIPEYTVPNGRELLFNHSWQEKEQNSNDPGKLIQQWNDLRQQITTHHFLYCDIGLGLIALGLSVLVLFMGLGIHTIDDFRQMRSPRSCIRFYLYAAVVWLSFVPAQIWYLNYIDAREDPPFVDNMAIPMESEMTVVLGLGGLPFIMLGVWLVTRGKELPVGIWSEPSFDAIGAMTVVVWLALVVAILITIASLATESPIIPSCVFTVYLLLAGKAVSASPARIRAGRGFEVVQ
jgi:hypothetical protein